MKIRMTFDFSDTERRAISHHYQGTFKATRERIECWLNTCVNTALGSLTATYQETGNKVNEAISHLDKADRKILLDSLLAEMEPETKEEEPAEEETEVDRG